jgi:hypothetical protein
MTVCEYLGMNLKRLNEKVAIAEIIINSPTANFVYAYYASY